MGDVYLAAAQGPGGFNKLLAVKELKNDLSDDDSYVAMFLEEARLAARLIHPNIVQTNEIGSEGNRHFMVMEYLDGRSLHRIEKRLGKPGPFTVGAHLRVIADALLGLHHAHEMRDFDGEPLDIVHRDVSPLNVFVTFDGQVKVLDFGIAKAVDSSLKTETGVLKGRVAYMAPEHAWGAKVDRRADVYAVGVMIWEAAARRRLWPGMPDVEILARIFREGPPSLRAVRPDVPEELDAICARAMAKYAIDRHPTAADLLEDLESHLAHRDDMVTTREIGTLASHAFAEERTKMTAAIERTLSRLRGGPRSGVMPTFESEVGPQSDPHLAYDESKSFSARRVKTPTSRHSQLAASDGPTALAESAAPEAALTEAPPARASKRLAIAIGTAIALPILGAALATGWHRSESPSFAVAPLSTVSASLPQTVDPQTVDLIIHVSPSSAQITIDGATVANPFHARYPKDDHVHRITASADGFETKSEALSFVSDVAIDLGLDRHAPPAPTHKAAAPPPPPPPSPPPRVSSKRGSTSGPAAGPPSDAPAPQAPGPSAHTEVNPAGGHAPLRPIATTNPYGDP
jgi:serine/threonine protein kinase